MKELDALCASAGSFYDRGYAFGSTGNLSVRVGGEVWITPTGKPLKGLTPDKLARIDLNGNNLGESQPSKEYPFHLAVYRNRGALANAIVHLHSTYSVALSCLANLDPAHPLPGITPYYFMRVAPLGIVPYYRPGSPQLAQAVGDAAAGHDCLLLLNHGLICAGSNWNEAVDRAEELEETSKLYFLTRGERLRELSDAEVQDIQRTFVVRR